MFDWVVFETLWANCHGHLLSQSEIFHSARARNLAHAELACSRVLALVAISDRVPVSLNNVPVLTMLIRHFSAISTESWCKPFGL